MAGAPKLVVAALCTRSGPTGGVEVLLSRRRADQSFAGAWEFPGGKVEPGEAPVDALVREVREELGCAVEVGAVAEVVFHRYEAFDLLMLVYRCRLVGGEPAAVQVAEVAWIDARRLPTLVMPPADVPLAARLAAAHAPV